MGRFVHFLAMRYILRWDRIICTFCIIIWFNIQAYHSFSTPLCHEHQYFVFRCIEEVAEISILILWYSFLIPHRFLCYWGSDGRGGRDIDGAATEGWTDSIDFSGNYFDKIIVSFFYEYKAYLKYAYLSFSIFSMLRIVGQILWFTEYGLIEKRIGRKKGIPEFLLDISGIRNTGTWIYYIFDQNVLYLT